MPEPTDRNLTRFVTPSWPNHLGFLKETRDILTEVNP